MVLNLPVHAVSRPHGAPSAASVIASSRQPATRLRPSRTTRTAQCPAAPCEAASRQRTPEPRRVQTDTRRRAPPELPGRDAPRPASLVRTCTSVGVDGHGAAARAEPEAQVPSVDVLDVLLAVEVLDLHEALLRLRSDAERALGHAVGVLGRFVLPFRSWCFCL